MEKIIQTAGKIQLGDFAPEFAHYNEWLEVVDDAVYNCLK